MNNPLKELEKRFKDFINLKDAHEFFFGFAKYCRFIEDTYPLNNIAHTIFSSSSTPSILINVKKVYESVVNNKKLEPPFFISPEGGSGIFMFHRYMIEGAKRVGLSNKQKVFLYTKMGDQKICLAGEKPPCSPFRGEEPQRFRIIHPILFRTETGHSARDIADRLGKEGKNKIAQDNTKKTIRAINEKCRKDLEITDDLITHTEQGGKNIYFLNRERFNFEIKK